MKITSFYHVSFRLVDNVAFQQSEGPKGFNSFHAMAAEVCLLNFDCKLFVIDVVKELFLFIF